jgi:asparagine synthase (glutamine-hydrolysing)
MCGIAGKAYFGRGKEVHPQELRLMVSKIIHRGPDDEGVFISKYKHVGLASCRLAIIDLSPRGHQPMSYLGRYTITFNGEIYNFQAERSKLIKQGYEFRSDSDTEVILALYSKYGKKCLDHLRGMFAFTIYDEKEDTLFMARDRIGVKPLKYLLTDSEIVFASELKAILALKNISPKIDPMAIQKYLLYGYVPAPLTGFEGIKKLEPGTYMFINLKRRTVTKNRYWKPSFNRKLHLSENEWCKKILGELETSTKLRMISDVPIGAFLSGGVDSSAVVATMARLSDKPIKTFSVVFDDPKYSEKKYADNIARRYKTDHHEILARPTSVENLPEIAYQYDEPFADNSSIVSFMVSKETAKYVKVALNGDGGDENFGGYPNRYLRLMRDVNYAKWIARIRPAAAAGIKALKSITKKSGLDKYQRFLEKSKLPLFEKFTSYSQIFSLNEINQITSNSIKQTMTPENLYRSVRRCFEMFNGKDLKDAGLKFDLLYFLPDQLLTKMDIATMRYSLEARSPLLDYKMIELAGKIPFNLKVKHGETKYIFKKALEEIVPKENLYRPKVGFTIPLDTWFKGKLNPYAKSILLSKRSMTKKYVDTDMVKRMINSQNKNEDFGPRIWSLMMLELWLRSYFK